MKTTAERSVEALAWAAVVIWLGLSLIMGLLAYVWLVVMVLGIILLSSAIYQRSRGWHTSLSLWIAGIWMAVFSVVEVVSEMVGALSGGDGLGINIWVYFGIALVSMGVAVVMRNVQADTIVEDGKRPSRGRSSSRTGRDADSGRQPYIPRRISDDQSSGWTAPPGDEEYDDYPTSQRSRASYREDTGRSRAYDSSAGQTQEYTAARPYDTRSRRTGQSRAVSSGGRASQSRQPAPRASRPAQPSRPAAEPSDLESRVEDIIRRSRERRNAPTDDLPY